MRLITTFLVLALISGCEALDNGAEVLVGGQVHVESVQYV
jgi:hypothetical protein